MHVRGRLITALALLSLAAPGVARAAPSPGDALVFRAPGGALKLVDATSGRALRSLPAGVLSADGKTLLSARVHAGHTLVRRIAVDSGKVIARRTIPGAWGFQRAAADGTRVAGGDHGLPIAMVQADRAQGYRGNAAHTRIAVLPSTLAGHVRMLDLRGTFGVDAVGPDGHYLYLIQHLGSEHYKVRAYDLKADLLDPQTVIDKREPNERMQGLPLARTETGNWVLTLYRRPSGVPFVHALMADSLFAFCIDLPATARVDVSVPSSWGVAVHGTQLFIANAATGWVAVVQLANFSLQRSSSLGPQPLTTAFTRPLAASIDGTRLYLARPQGLISIDASTLAPSAPLSPRAFGALALGTGGSVLYGAGSGSSQALDPLTGASDGSPQPTGRLSLVGVVRTSYPGP
jgi:hypothetical protein